MSKTIMLIDDSPTIRALMKDALTRAGFDVVEAVDGEDAMSKLDGRPLGAVVCDLSMPHMDGLSFLAHLRTNPRYKFTPLMVLSTDTRQNMKMAVKQGGAQAFMRKPCTPSALVDAVQRLCI